MSHNVNAAALLPPLPWPPMPPSPPEARFDVGQLVRHVRFGYRGVVIDVDAEFGLTDEWYEEVARSRPPKDRPWYHVLPDGAQHTTYVAERNLEVESEPRPIEHPLVDEVFEDFDGDRYVRARTVN